MSTNYEPNSTKISRPRGRPRTFDEHNALSQAMRAFWAKGFAATTIDDLVAAIGIGRPSLYAAFGDKDRLFMRCLEHYRDNVSVAALKALEAAPTVQSAIRAFLEESVESATGRAGNPLGCLLNCVIPSIEDPLIRAFSASAMKKAEELITRRFEEGIAAADVPPDFPCAARGRQVVGMALALALRARLGTPREELLDEANIGTDLIFQSSNSMVGV